MTILLYSAFITVGLIERVWSTFLSTPRNTRRYHADWMFSAALVLYLLVISIGIVGFYRFAGQRNLAYCTLGICVYIIGATMRRSAIEALGDQWNLFTYAENTYKIVAKRPFRFFRHPYYLGTLFELVGFSIASTVYWAVPLIFVLQLPLLWHRARSEEYYLTMKFGPKYLAYKSRVPGFTGRITREEYRKESTRLHSYARI